MTTQELETVRDTVGRLAKVWPPLRGERLVEYLEAIQRQTDLEPIDVRAGFGLLVDAYREAYPPNPADLVAFAHLARENRLEGERQAELVERAGAGWVTRLGVGCPTCRHHGDTPEECVTTGRWVDGGAIVHCLEHNVGWQGTMPPDPDPGPDATHTSAQTIREKLRSLTAASSTRRALRDPAAGASVEEVAEHRKRLLAEARAALGQRTHAEHAEHDPEPVASGTTKDPWA